LGHDAESVSASVIPAAHVQSSTAYWKMVKSAKAEISSILSNLGDFILHLVLFGGSSQTPSS